MRRHQTARKKGTSAGGGGQWSPTRKAARKSTTSLTSSAPTYHCMYLARTRHQRQQSLHSSNDDKLEYDSSSDSGTDSAEFEAANLEPLPADKLTEAYQQIGAAYHNDLQLDLEPATLTALSKCAPSHSSNWPGINGLSQGWPSKVQLSQEVGRFRVYVPTAAKKIQKNELIGCVAGTLMEKDKWERLVDSQTDARHLLAFDIPAADLHNIYRYPANGPDLVLSTMSRCNEFRFAQDASWHMDDSEENNAMPWLAMINHPTARAADGRPLPVPLPMVYAEKLISQGDEICMSWGKDLWETYHEIKVFKQGAASHKLQGRLARLKQLLQQVAVSNHQQAATAACDEAGCSKKARIELPTQSAAAAAAAALLKGHGVSNRYLGMDPNAEEWYWEDNSSSSSSRNKATISIVSTKPKAVTGEEGVGNNAAPATTAVVAGASTVAAVAPGIAAAAGDSSDCENMQSEPEVEGQSNLHVQRNGHRFRVLGDDEVQHVFPGLTASYDYSQIPVGTLQQLQAHNATDVPENKLVQALPDCKLAVAEIVDLHHPVRWCTVPSTSAYTVLAAANIKMGEPLIDYVGRYCLGSSQPESEYIYSIAPDQLSDLGVSSFISNLTEGLLIDNKHAGNISRFINSCWGRPDTSPCKPLEANLEADVFWNETINMPVVRFFATRNIKKGEECAVDYGRDYWRITARNIMMAQQEYAAETLLQQETVLQRLRSAVQQRQLTQQQLDAAVNYVPDL